MGLVLGGLVFDLSKRRSSSRSSRKACCVSPLRRPRNANRRNPRPRRWPLGGWPTATAAGSARRIPRRRPTVPARR